MGEQVRELKDMKIVQASGKLRWDLLPLSEIEDVVKILTFGANKYSDNNWKNAIYDTDHKNRYFAALMRHLVAWRNGEVIDPESKLPHLAHAMCNVLFLMWFDKNGDKKIETTLAREDIKDPYKS